MSSWGFYHPGWLAAGVLLMGLPVLIHWLSRRRVRVVEWAAFEFLLGAQRRDQRRVRLEDWLLLALRCLLIVLLALTVARPWQRTDWQALASDSSRIQHFLVLDDTQSMQAMIGNETAWEIARQQLMEFCRTAAQRGRGDSVTVWLLSQPEEPRLTDWPLYPERLAELFQRIESWTVGDAGESVGRGLNEIVPQVLARPGTAARTLTLLTDLRAVDWEAREESATGTLPLESLEVAAGEGVAVLVWDAATSAARDPAPAGELVQESNLNVVSVTSAALHVEGVATSFEVRVANRGRRDTEELEVRLAVDDQHLLSQKLETLGAGQEQTVQFDYTYLPRGGDLREGAGVAATRATERGRWSVVEARLVAGRPERDNRLLADDRLSTAVWVERPLEVLLVEGGAVGGQVGERAESFYLQRALAPLGIDSSFQPRLVSAIDWDAQSLDGVAVIYLLDVPRLSPEVTERLAAWVRRGGGLFIVAGPATDATWHNAGLGEGGVQLAPLVLRSWQETAGDGRGKTWSIDAPGVPAESDFAGLVGDEQPLLRSVSWWRWWSASMAGPGTGERATAVGGTQILATLAGGSPLVAWREYGVGRVLELVSGLTDESSNWVREPAFVVFQQPACEWLAGARRRVPRQQVGESLVWELDPARDQMAAALRYPNQRSIFVVAREPLEESTKRWQLQSPRTEMAGVYRWELTGTDGQNYDWAVNVLGRLREGDLRRADGNVLRSQVARARESARRPIVLASGGMISDHLPGVERREWAMSLGWLMLFGLVVESWWAWQVGRRR